MIQIARDDDEPEYGLKEFVESMSITLLDTFHEAHPRLQPQLDCMKSRQQHDPPSHIGCNRQLPISQSVAKSKGGDEVECRNCNLMINLQDYEVHLQTQHNDYAPPLKCRKCGRGFEACDADALIRHTRQCSQHLCDECDRTLRTAKELSDHIMWAHSNERPYVCSTCGEACETQRRLDIHEAHHVPYVRIVSSITSK